MDTNKSALTSLVEIGLSEKEAEIYLKMLEYSDATPGTIARVTGIKRSTAYIILQNLSLKGLLVEIKQANYQRFKALPYETIIEQIKQKREVLSENINNLESFLNEMPKEKIQAKEQKSEAWLHTGDDLLGKIYKEVLGKKLRLMHWENSENQSEINKLETEKFHKNCAKENLDYRAIREQIKSEIMIYGNKVAIFMKHKKQVLIIEDANFSESMEVIFSAQLKARS